MAELDQNQTDTGTAEVTTPTPLESILDGSAADAPAQSEGGEAGFGGRDDNPLVPLKALREERRKRQEAERYVQQAEQEIQKYRDAQWGLSDEVEEQPQQEQQPSSDAPSANPVAENYHRSLANFTKKHSDDGVVDKVNAAFRRLSPEQYQHVEDLGRTQADPVEAIRGYMDSLGLLDFKGRPD